MNDRDYLLFIIFQIEEYPTMILYHKEDRVGVYNGVHEVDQIRHFVDTSRMLRDELWSIVNQGC